MKLDMNAETPLYMQLKEAIKAAIQRWHLSRTTKKYLLK